MGPHRGLVALADALLPVQQALNMEADQHIVVAQGAVAQFEYFGLDVQDHFHQLERLTNNETLHTS